MRPTISLRELEDDAAAVLREVQAGRTFTVSLKGKPVAELRPVAPRQFVPRSMIA